MHARILIVEDEAIIALNLRRRLMRLGYIIVATTMSGEEAVRQAEALRPDVVLMDIRLSGQMDGIEAATQIHERFRIPVIFMSAYPNEPLLERIHRFEPVRYLSKPFSDLDVIRVLELVLRGSDPAPNGAMLL
jgi:CheY-like chemotaxis protein